MRQHPRKPSRARSIGARYVAIVHATVVRFTLELPRFLRLLYQKAFSTPIFLLAQAIAFKVLLSVVPFLVLLTGLLGGWLAQEEAFAVVEQFVGRLLPLYVAERVLTYTRELALSAGVFTVAGGIGLFVSALTLMTTLRQALTLLFQEHYHKERSLVRGYLFDFRMVLQVGVLFIITLFLNFSIQWIDLKGFTWLLEHSDSVRFIQSSRYILLSVVSPYIPLVISLFIFAQLFYLVPLPHPSLRSVFIGSAVTSFLWLFSNHLFTLYALNLTHFDLTSTFGLVLAFFLWVYISGLIFCLGALVVQVIDTRQRLMSDA